MFKKKKKCRSEFMKLVDKYKRGADLQLDQLRVLKYTEEEKHNNKFVLYKSCIRKLFDEPIKFYIHKVELDNIEDLAFKYLLIDYIDTKVKDQENVFIKYITICVNLIMKVLRKLKISYQRLL